MALLIFQRAVNLCNDDFHSCLLCRTVWAWPARQIACLYECNASSEYKHRSGDCCGRCIGKGKAQHVTNSRKLFEVAFCTYIFLFLILCVFLLNEPICVHVTLPKSFFRIWEDVRKGVFNA